MAFKLENGNVAPALYFSGSVLATEQFSIIRDKRHRTVHSDKKKGGGGPNDCWPSCLSSIDQILSFKTDHYAVRANNVAY